MKINKRSIESTQNIGKKDGNHEEIEAQSNAGGSQILLKGDGKWYLQDLGSNRDREVEIEKEIEKMDGRGGQKRCQEVDRIASCKEVDRMK